MNKALQLTATSLLVSGMSLAQPLHADTANLASEASSANSPSDTADSADRTVSASSRDALGFTLQHRFNGGEPLPTETIKFSPEQPLENPLFFLEALKQNFSKHLEKQKKPLQIDTELELLLSARDTKFFGQLPKVFIKTNVESDGSGKSDLVFPAYRREVPEKFGKGLFDWKGLDGQFSFTDQFENITAALNLAGFTAEEDNFAASLGKSAFSGTFDADFMPTQMKWNLPSFKVRDNDGKLDLQAMTLKLNVDKTPKGLELNNVNFNVGHVGFSEPGFKTSLDGLAVTTAGSVQNGVINYTLQTQIDKLVIISDKAPKEALELSHVGKLAFSRIDEEALLALQTTAHQLRGQGYHPMLLMIMLGQFMEVAPKLLAKSPEIALTPFTVTTSKGNLQAHLNIRLDSKKVTELAKPALIKALQAQVNFTIGKELLKQDVTGLQVNFIKAWLVDAGDGNYKFNAELKDSKLTVNGHKIPLPIGAQ